MDYLSSSKIAKIWDLSERTVRNYCAEGRVQGAYIQGKTWMIPESAEKPGRKPRERKVPNTLLDRLRFEKENQINGGIYHRLQIDFTYNSNHMEGSTLTHDQTRYIFETNTINTNGTEETINVDDIVESVNHFSCIDLVIDFAKRDLSESFIKQLHYTLKSGTGDSRKPWFNVGGYKKLENEVGGKETTEPKQVPKAMRELLSSYKPKEPKTFEELIEFHAAFERIHPFQDGNGRIGRLILLKECLNWDIVPFIIDEQHRLYYYRGLNQWSSQRGYLIETCLSAQDFFKRTLDRFGIEHTDQTKTKL